MTTIINSGFYRSEIVVDGWATFSVYGPFHRHRAIKFAEICELKAKQVIFDEEIKDKTNVIFDGSYTLKELSNGKNTLPKSF